MHGSEPDSGCNVPDFEPIKVLGTGGSGAVHLALDTRSSTRVALKIVPLRGADETRTRRRFERELTSLARMQHPSIPSFVRGGIIEGASVGFVATSFVDGTTLDETSPEARSRITTILDVLSALDALHAAGLVHRDVKPSNVLRPSDPSRVAVLVDFGIAHTLPETGTPWTRLTSCGQVVGSPHYIAPERIEGAPGDARSDVYAVGVMLFEILYGRRPFTARTPTLTMLQAITADLPRLESLDVESTSETRAMHALVERALARDPERRVASARALGIDLEALVPSDEAGRRALEREERQTSGAARTRTSEHPSGTARAREPRGRERRRIRPSRARTG